MESIEYCFTANFVKEIRYLVHLFAHRRHTVSTGVR